MDPTVGAAVVTGFVGTIVGLMGLIQASRAARMSKETQVVIARLNLDAESRQRSYQLALAEAKPAEEATDHLWSVIQDLRDFLLWIMDSRVDHQIRYSDLESRCGAAVRATSNSAAR
jgi:hypothetical protein